MAIRSDMTGMQFGALSIEQRLPNDSAGFSKWLAKCSCGKHTEVRGVNLRNGHTTSCGCHNPRPLIDRLMEKTQVGPSCWEWTGRKNIHGYGWLVAVELKGDRSRRIELAHRAMWFAKHGPIPAGMFICHSCDNPGCVCPDHLFLGTPKDNAIDMASKGRWNSQYKIPPTHCKRGHEFSERNTRINGSGKRICRACAALWAKTFRKAKKNV